MFCMRVCDHIQNVNRTDTVSPGCHSPCEPAEAAGCRLLMKSTDRCAWLAATQDGAVALAVGDRPDVLW